MEKAIVSANWRNRIPVVPGKKATGTNTATNTNEVAMTAPVTSFMALDAAFIGLAFLQVALDVFYDDYGVVYHQAGGQGYAEQRQGIDGESQYLDESKSTDERHRNGNCRENRGGPIFEKAEYEE